MEKASTFVTKSMPDGGLIHFCKKSLQCFNDKTATISSYPIQHNIQECISVDSKHLIRAYSICEWKPQVRLNKKQLILSDKELKFKATLQFATDYDPIYFTKKEKKRSVSLPDNFKSILKVLYPFTTRDSDNQWAEAINITDQIAYATNNIVVVKTQMNENENENESFPDILIPKSLIEAILKIDLEPSSLYLSEGRITIFYNNGAFIQTSQIAEKPPEIAAIFQQFKKPSMASDTDITSLRNVISMASDDEIWVKKGTLFSNNASIKGTGFGNTRANTDNLLNLLAVFDRMEFGKQLLMFDGEHKGNQLSAIMAARK